MRRKRLDSWKSIADYLQRSTRTVQRWHAEHGLPVHHFRGLRGAAFAYPEEIDAWLPGFSQKSHEAIDGLASVGRKRSAKLAAVGNDLWGMRSERNIDSTCEIFREAIIEDAENATAWIGLANAQIFKAIYGLTDGPMAYRRAEDALRRASEIDTERLDLKCGLAWLDMAWWRERAVGHDGFREVLQRDPDNSLALAGQALLYVAEGRLGEAWERACSAWSGNTMAHPLSVFLCWIPYLAGDYDKALQQISDTKASGGYAATHAAIEALTLIQSGSMDLYLESLEHFRCEYAHDQTLLGALGFYYAQSGNTARAAALLERLTAPGGQSNSSYAAALVLLALGRQRECIEALEASYASGSLWSIGFRADPMLRGVREALSGRIDTCAPFLRN